MVYAGVVFGMLFQMCHQKTLNICLVLACVKALLKSTVLIDFPRASRCINAEELRVQRLSVAWIVGPASLAILQLDALGSSV